MPGRPWSPLPRLHIPSQATLLARGRASRGGEEASHGVRIRDEQVQSQSAYRQPHREEGERQGRPAWCRGERQPQSPQRLGRRPAPPPALSAVLTGPPAARRRSGRLPNPQGLSGLRALPQTALGRQQDCLGRVRWAPAGPHTSNWRVTKEHGQRTGSGSLSPTPVPVCGGGWGLLPQLGWHQGPPTLLPEHRFIWHLDEMVLTAS